MNTVNGWLVIWGLAMSIVALIFVLLTVNKHRTMELLAANKQKIIDTRTQERNEARKQRDDLNLENANLYEAIDEQAKTNTFLLDENYKLRRDLTEAKATVELLRMPSDHATVPLQEAAPMAYAEAKPAIDQAAQSTPKRTKRGKITGTP